MQVETTGGSDGRQSGCSGSLGVCSRTRRANQASDVTDSPLNAPSATARGSCFPVCEAAPATANHSSSSLDGHFGLKRRQLPLSASSLLHFLQFNSHILFCLCISFVLRFAAVLRSREYAYSLNRHCLLKNYHQPLSATPDQGSGTLPRRYIMALELPQPSEDIHLSPRSPTANWDDLVQLVKDSAGRLSARAESSPGAAQEDQGIGITSFLTAIVVSIIVFSVQTGLFVLLRNKLARIL